MQNGSVVKNNSIPPPPRSVSMPYPKNNSASMFAKAQYYCRQHNKSIFTMFAVVCLFLLILVTQEGSSAGARFGFRGSATASSLRKFASGITYQWGGAIDDGYFDPRDAVASSTEFKFGAVTDLDELSKVDEAKKPEFYSKLLPGKLKKSVKSDGKPWYDIQLMNDDVRKVITKHNEAGRGAEFSELTIYQNRLITLDDRTGELFEILNDESGLKSYVVPRFVFTEGYGNTDKGMKWEWSTVKNNELYLGSMGKEYTDNQGNIINKNNLWIIIVNADGQVRREDWSEQYEFVRRHLNCEFPGYLIIESINWSDKLQKWVFLPRRISHEGYDDVKDEHRGGKQLVLVDEGFTKATTVDLQFTGTQVDDLKGFSTFAFVPHSNDQHALAVRSVEENCVDFTPQCDQRSYFIVFDIMTGEMLSDEVQTPDHVKYEGVEFVDLYVKPPAPTSK